MRVEAVPRPFDVEVQRASAFVEQGIVTAEKEITPSVAYPTSPFSLRCYAHGMRFSSSLFVDHSAATGHRLSIRLEPSADSDASENYLIPGENSAFSDVFRSINQQNDRAIVGTALLSAYIKVNTPHFAGIVRLNSDELSHLSNHRVQ